VLDRAVREGARRLERERLRPTVGRGETYAVTQQDRKRDDAERGECADATKRLDGLLTPDQMDVVGLQAAPNPIVP
jgi:hypothetical protein